MLTTPDTVSLAGHLDGADLRRAAAPLAVVVDDEVRARVDRGRRLFGALRHGDGDGDGERQIYGATTGFGALVGYAGRADEADQCDNTLAHLGAGQGPDLPPGIVRVSRELGRRRWPRRVCPFRRGRGPARGAGPAERSPAGQATGEGP